MTENTTSNTNEEIIALLQKKIWEAEHFISIRNQPNLVYWQGYLAGCEVAMNSFRAFGVSVTDVTSKMEKPSFEIVPKYK